MTEYDDILPLPHKVSDRRAPMPMEKRAAQFAPFAALSGYEEAVQEAGRRTAKREELTEDRAEMLDQRLRWLRDHIIALPEITVTWFVPDEKKSGGAYRTVTDHAKRLESAKRMLHLQSGITVPLEDVWDLLVPEALV